MLRVGEILAMTSHAVEFSSTATAPVVVPAVGRMPRISKLLAFAHYLDAQIRSGAYDDMADAARTLGISRGRLTQFMGLLLLAPSIQAEVLGLQPITAGRDPINERVLRAIVAEPVWRRQMVMWNDLSGRSVE